MDFDELETREEEVGPDDEILSKARTDPGWLEFVRFREQQLQAEEEEERARLEKLQKKAQQDSVESFRGQEIMARYREWELRQVEKMRRRLQESTDPSLVFEQGKSVKGWDEFVKDSPDLFPCADTNSKEEAYPTDSLEETEDAENEQEEEVEEAEEAEEREEPWARDAAPPAPPPSAGEAAAPRRGRRRGGAFSRALAEGGAGEEAEGAEERPPPREAVEDPTGLDPEDPTFEFVRKAIDANRGKNKAERKQEEHRERWQADVEAGVMVPYLAEVLERIEEDEMRDPDRQEDVLPIESMLAKIEEEEHEDKELEKVKDFLPDIERKRQELTLAICAPQQEVPLANPAIQVLQEMYPEQDLALRDSLESFEVAQSSHEPTEEGYLDTITAKRAEAAAEEREWMAWQAKQEMKRRLQKEGLALMLPPAPKNSKIGNLPPSHQQKVGGGGSSSSSSVGLGRGIGGPRFAPLARSVAAEPRPRAAAAARPPSPPPPPPPPEESEEDRIQKEEFERLERARLSKERLERMKERRRQREAGEAC